MRLTCCPAAVDHQAGPGNEGCGRRCKKYDGSCDLLHAADPAEGDSAQNPISKLGVCEERGSHGRFEESRRDRVDSNVIRRQLNSHRLGQTFNRVLCHAVNRTPFGSDMTHLRGDVDDRTGIQGAIRRLDHFSGGCLCRQKCGSNIKSQHFIQMSLGYIDEWFRNVHSCVIYEDVEPLESINLRTKLVNVSDIADQHFGAPARAGNLVLNFFEFASRSAEQQHLRSRLSKSNGRGGPKTAARTRYERYTAVQPEGFRENRGTESSGYDLSPGLPVCPT